MRNVYEVVIIKPNGEKKKEEIVSQTREQAYLKHTWIKEIEKDEHSGRLKYTKEQLGWYRQIQYKGTLGD